MIDAATGAMIDAATRDAAVDVVVDAAVDAAPGSSKWACNQKAGSFL